MLKKKKNKKKREKKIQIKMYVKLQQQQQIFNLLKIYVICNMYVSVFVWNPKRHLLCINNRIIHTSMYIRMNERS